MEHVRFRVTINGLHGEEVDSCRIADVLIDRRLGGRAGGVGRMGLRCDLRF